MLFLLSPAKALDYDTPAGNMPHTQPLFQRQSAELIAVLKAKSPQEISSLMKLSDALAGLNAARYQAWSPTFTASNSKQAALAFNGDVYGGLDAKTLSEAQLAWAQNHLCILSGLYGVLRPLDWMQPYRLEMGTALVTGRGKNLYQFWGTQIADYLNVSIHAPFGANLEEVTPLPNKFYPPEGGGFKPESVLDERAAADGSPVIVNLASEEYFKSVNRKVLKARVVTCVFEEWRGDKYKIISFMAKRARGLMVRYAIENGLATVEKLKGFDAEGYGFDASASGLDRLVFRRGQGV